MSVEVPLATGNFVEIFKNWKKKWREDEISQVFPYTTETNFKQSEAESTDERTLSWWGQRFQLKRFANLSYGILVSCTRAAQLYHT